MRNTFSTRAGAAGISALLAFSLCGSLHAAIDEQPSAAEVVAASVKAIGGAEAYAKITSIHAAGRAVLPMGEMKMDVKQDMNGRFAIEQEIPGMGGIKLASDGRYGWMQNPMSGQWELMDEAMVQGSRQQVEFFRMLSPSKEEIGRMKVVGRADRNGQPHWQVRMTDEDGTESMVFFNEKTHLLASVEMEQDMGMGPMKMVMAFSDWKSVGDIKFFHKIEVEQGMGMNVAIEFSDIKVNTVVDSDFAAPPAIAEQIRQREEARKAAEAARDLGSTGADKPSRE